MAPPTYPTTKTTVYVFDGDLETAGNLAKKKAVSVSVILRDAIKAGLEATRGEK